MSTAVVPIETPPMGLDWPPPRPRLSRGATRDARERERARKASLAEARRQKLLPVAVRLVQTMRAVRPLRAQLALAEGEVLTEFKELYRFEALGYVRFSDFAAEALGRNPRTARRRMALHRVINRTPALREPYLAGRIGVSQILALEPVVTAKNATIWVRLAERLPYARLAHLVQRARDRKAELSPNENMTDNANAYPTDNGEQTDSDTAPRRQIRLLSPRSVGFAIEHGLETAQRILGWDAPRDECLDAILSEAASNLDLPASSTMVPEPPLLEPNSLSSQGTAASPASSTAAYGGSAAASITDPRSAASNDSVFYHRNELKRARRVLNRADRTLGRLRRVAGQEAAPVDESTPPSTPPSMPGWAPDEPGSESPRKTLSATSLLARYQAITRARNPLRALEARLVYYFFALRVGALLHSQDDLALCAHLLRVTERTARNLAGAGGAFEYCHALADAFIQGKIGFTQVLMLHGMEALPVRDWVRRAKTITLRQLRRELRLRYRLQWVLPFAADGVPTVDLESELMRLLLDRGWTLDRLEAELESRGFIYPPGASTDLAENPVALSRLEALADLLILDTCAHENPDAPSSPLPRKTLSIPGRHVAVVIWARPRIWDHWCEMFEHIQAACPALPPWAAATLLVKAAMDEWERMDPDRIPTEVLILERDDYRCRVPGCSSRKQLEVHHIIFRSHCGPDHPENLVTLCHQHHHHAVHRGTLHVTGEAPHALVWELGGVTYIGERSCGH